MGDVKTPQITLHVHIIVLNVTYISRVKLILSRWVEINSDALGAQADLNKK